jgi:hypothetical protein
MNDKNIKILGIGVGILVAICAIYAVIGYQNEVAENAKPLEFNASNANAVVGGGIITVKYNVNLNKKVVFQDLHDDIQSIIVKKDGTRIKGSTDTDDAFKSGKDKILSKGINKFATRISLSKTVVDKPATTVSATSSDSSLINGTGSITTQAQTHQEASLNPQDIDRIELTIDGVTKTIWTQADGYLLSNY